MRRRVKRKNKAVFTAWVIGFILTLIFLALLFFKSNFFNIKKVEVGQKELDCASKQQIIDTAQVLGKNFFFIEKNKVAQSIKEKFICIKNVAVSRYFPDKVKIDLTPRQPLAVLIPLKNPEASPSSLEQIATPSAAEQTEGYLTDDEGIIFQKSNNFSDILKIFIYDKDLSLGKKITGNGAENSLKILDKLKQFGLDVKTSLILDNYLIIYTSPKITFRLDGQVDSQIASLQLILKMAKIDSEELVFIDLRFDKPVISIAPKKHG